MEWWQCGSRHAGLAWWTNGAMLCGALIGGVLPWFVELRADRLAPFVWGLVIAAVGFTAERWRLGKRN